MTLKIDCARRFQFCAGHRVYGHENKCSNMHGHNYVLWATARGKETHGDLDNLGRVIDFSVIKNEIGYWIDTRWDHGFIAYMGDKEAIDAVRSVKNSCNEPSKEYLMSENPTAENMALHLLNEICPILFEETDIEIWKIKLYETENCYAEVTL